MGCVSPEPQFEGVNPEQHPKHVQGGVGSEPTVRKETPPPATAVAHARIPRSELLGRQEATMQVFLEDIVYTCAQSYLGLPLCRVVWPTSDYRWSVSVGWQSEHCASFYPPIQP